MIYALLSPPSPRSCCNSSPTITNTSHTHTYTYTHRLSDYHLLPTAAQNCGKVSVTSVNSLAHKYFVFELFQSRKLKIIIGRKCFAKGNLKENQINKDRLFKRGRA